MKKYFKFTTLELVEISMLVALAVILDLSIFKFQLFKEGGSVSFTMVPLFILAFRHNFFKSFIGIAVVYGLVTCMLDGHGFQYYPYDYFIAYGCISFASLFRDPLFKNKKNDQNQLVFAITGLCAVILLCCTGRLFGHTLSSMIIFKYGLKDSIIYNSTYVVPSALICCVVLSMLYPRLLKIK